jgi:hypothetical protein
VAPAHQKIGLPANGDGAAGAAGCQEIGFDNRFPTMDGPSEPAQLPREPVARTSSPRDGGLRVLARIGSLAASAAPRDLDAAVEAARFACAVAAQTCARAGA